MRSALCFFILFFSFTVFAKSPIRDACGDHETTALTKAESIDDLHRSICRVTNTKLTPPSVIDLSKSVLALVEKYKMENTDQSAWRENLELDLAVRNLAVAVTQAGRGQPPKIQTPYAKALYELTRKFGTWEQRKADEDGYLAALKKTALLTKNGREVYACFSRNDGKNLTSGGLLETQADLEDPDRDKPPPPGYGGGMGFNVLPEEEGKLNGNWKKFIRFDWKSDPISALQSLQHEFKHACNARAHMVCQLKTFKEQRIIDECEQQAAVDELRAYKFDTQVFLGMAQAAPELVCSMTLVSESFGKIPVRMADFNASFDEQIADGRFVDHIISFYLKIGTYQSEESFYTKTDDGKKMIRPDFLKKVREAGFFYQPTTPTPK